jgi:hypothetical protein
VEEVSLSSYGSGGRIGVSSWDRYTARIFAWIGVILMVLMAFQAVADRASATSIGSYQSEQADADAQPISSDKGAGTVSPNANDIPATTPVYSDLPGGSVDGYGAGSTDNFAVSEALGTGQLPQMSRTQDHLEFDTIWGSYLVSDAHPESLSFQDTDGTMLVSESYFSLASPYGSTVPVNGKIVRAEPNAIEVHYDLTPCASPSAIVASMDVTLNFTETAFPKITASVSTVSSEYANAQVVWTVFPSPGAEWMGYGEKVVSRGTLLANYPAENTYVPEMSVNLGVPAQIQNKVFDKFKIDWSDAKSGFMSIGSFKMLSGGSGYGIEIAFDKGKTEIDPSIVTRTSAGSSIKIASFQRHTFWYGGYYWVFYAGLTGGRARLTAALARMETSGPSPDQCLVSEA